MSLVCVMGKSRENEEQLSSFFPHLLSKVRVILLPVLGVKDLPKCSCMLQRLWAWCFSACGEPWSVAFLLLLDWQESDSLLASSPPLELFLNVSFWTIVLQ